MAIADPFATLGLPRTFDLDLGAIDGRQRELSRVVHPDRHAKGSSADRREALARTMELNQAVRTLRDPLKRAEALLALGGGLDGIDAPDAEADPSLLAEVFELREQLDDAKAAGDLATLDGLRELSDRRIQAAVKNLTVAFSATSPLDTSAVRREIATIRYFRRLVDELTGASDEGA